MAATFAVTAFEPRELELHAHRAGRNLGDFDALGADIERDWVARTNC
ncbi:hypothetical protein [Streptomyces sp. NPDC053069]